MKARGFELVLGVVGLATLVVGIGAVTARSVAIESDWALEGTWSDTCSCKVACPCFFGSEPTEGFCEGTSLLEVERGHFGGVEIDGLTAIVTMRIGEWARIYVAESATAEQAEAVGAVIPLALPFLGMSVVETVEVVPISVERTETTLKYAAPESAVELEIVMGVDGEPIKISNLPAQGLPFPKTHDHTQYRSVHSKHDSAAHHFEWRGRNGLVSKVDLEGELPRSDP